MIDIQKFATELSLKFGINHQQKIALAVSGGADSMCLTLLMQNAGFNVTCLIVDHGLRPDSDVEALATKSFLEQQNIDVKILKWLEYDPKRNISNLHHKAREARYSLLLEYCAAHEIKHLLLAHNKNDQAENVLLRIGRGTGIDGIAFMKNSQEIQGCNIIRPLLNFTRSQIEETLRWFDWKWVEDPANDNERFARTRVRALLKGNECGLTVDRLHLLASNAARARDYLEHASSEALKVVAAYQILGYVALDTASFLRYHQEIQLRVLSNILRKIGGRHSIRLVNLERLLEKIQDIKNWHDTTFHDCEIVKAKQLDRLLFIKEHKTIQAVSMSPICSQIIWDRRFLIKKEGESAAEFLIEALSPNHLMALKDKIDQSINLEHHKIKWTIPVITYQGNVVACPSLGWFGEYVKFKAELNKVLSC